MEKVNLFNCKRKKEFSMGPSVKFILAIIDSISKKKKMGVNFFSQNWTQRGRASCLWTQKLLILIFEYFPNAIHICIYANFQSSGCFLCVKVTLKLITLTKKERTNILYFLHISFITFPTQLKLFCFVFFFVVDTQYLQSHDYIHGHRCHHSNNHNHDH